MFGVRLLMRDLDDIGVNVAADSKERKLKRRGEPDKHQHLDRIQGSK